jgi:uncharacterized protein YbbK (DUF523 family)
MALRILMSACLAGLRTRYNGASVPHPLLDELVIRALIIPVCPEILGGLGIPRDPCHFRGGDGSAVLAGTAQMIDSRGLDRTAAFLRGAEETVRVARLVIPDLIIFKEGSPSCGLRRVDIEGDKQPGCGVTTAMILPLALDVLSEQDSLALHLP